MKDLLNLDVDSPDKVPAILRRAAEAYRDSAAELSASWQDRSAGRPWNALAGILERAANSAETRLRALGHGPR